MRLIDADALTDEIMERYCAECDNRKGIKNGKYRIIYEVGDAPCRACRMDDMKDELDNAPTIEPERTGKWIRWYETKEDEAGTEYIPHCRCSKCGTEYDPHSSKFVSFCNVCGAKMEETS